MSLPGGLDPRILLPTLCGMINSSACPKAPRYDDLFDLPSRGWEKVALASDAVVLRRFAFDGAAELLAALNAVLALAPFRNMVTPGGYTMSVAMTNCGAAGWVSDLAGYRYTRQDPLSGNPWPPMPAIFLSLATRAAAVAGFERFLPDACLINRYAPGAKLSLHQDKNETDFTAAIVSVSLGLPAKFLFGGLRRNDRVTRVELRHGDVVVWGRAARLAYHGVDSLKDGDHPLTGRCRFNLTFRTAL
jgi:alkylated DNA repair protein (DNA oxidative demethylase)